MDFVELAKRHLDWNSKYLTHDSGLLLENIAECFADIFTIVANGRQYKVNYQQYFDFLCQFKSSIESIHYDVEEFVCQDRSVIMPLTAKVVRVNGNIEWLVAMLWLKFNSCGKIILWHEVYHPKESQ